MNLPEEAYFFAFILILFSSLYGIADWMDRRPKKIRIGDKVPQSMKDAWAEGKGVGGFVTVCPCCDRIDNIFHP